MVDSSEPLLGAVVTLETGPSGWGVSGDEAGEEVGGSVHHLRSLCGSSQCQSSRALCAEYGRAGVQTGDEEEVKWLGRGGRAHCGGLGAEPEPLLSCSPCGPFSPPLRLPPRCQVRLWRRQACVNLALRASVHSRAAIRTAASAWLRRQRCVSCSSGRPGLGASTVGSREAGVSPRFRGLVLTPRTVAPLL